MKDVVLGAGQQARRVLGGFTAGQKTVSALALIGLLVAGLLFYRWASTPTYVPLFSNLSGTDASAIVDKLSADGTPYQITDGGSTITVPQEVVYSERIKMSGQGLPASDQTGYALLDKQSLTTSQFMQQVDYQRAVEGELEKTIDAIQGVRTAVVHLAIPQQSVFTSDKDKPTASVLVSTQPGVTMSKEQVQAITNLVSSSVSGMSASDVSVADSTGRVLSTAGGSAGLAGQADDRAQTTADYEARTSAQLQDMVDRLVGPGHGVVQVTADLDYDRTQTTTEQYTAQPSVPPIADSSTKETYSGAGSSTAGILGPTGTPLPTTAPGSSYSKETLTRDNAVGRTVESRVAAPGSVRKLSVGILLDSASAAKVDLEALKTLVSSSIGIDAQRGDTIEVTSLAFDQATQKAAQAQLDKAASAATQAGMVSMARTGFLVLLVLAVLVLAFLSMRSRGPATVVDDAAGLDVLGPEFGSGTTPTGTVTVGTRPLLYEPADRTGNGHGNGQGNGNGNGHGTRDEVGMLVERQPDEVAQLLRGWLAERRG